MSDIKKLSSEDIGYAAAKTGLGSIPIVGALASEILGLIITPPLEKRRQKWMTEVGDKLKQLEDQDKIDLTTLASNEQFIDAVLIATSLAIKTCEDEKIKAFQNAILNTALGESPDKTKVQIFLTLLDNFTIWHIKILHFINNPKKWFADANIEPPRMLMGSLSSVLKRAFPELQGQTELTDVIWRDLHDSGLHRTSDLKTSMSSDALLANRASDLGKEFLKFITEPEM